MRKITAFVIFMFSFCMAFAEADSSVIVISSSGPSDVYLMPVIISTTRINAFTNMRKGNFMDELFMDQVVIVCPQTYNFLKSYLLKFDQMPDSTQMNNVGALAGSVTISIFDTSGIRNYFAGERNAFLFFQDSFIKAIKTNQNLPSSEVKKLVEDLDEFAEGIKRK